VKRSTLAWAALALAGLLIAAGAAYAASKIATQPIGLSSEPISAGRGLAPKATRTARPKPARTARPTRRRTPTPTPTGAPTRTATAVPTTVPTVDNSGSGGDDSGGGGKGRDHPEDD
jgi:hypothetical protein